MAPRVPPERRAGPSDDASPPVTRRRARPRGETSTGRLYGLGLLAVVPAVLLALLTTAAPPQAGPPDAGRPAPDGGRALAVARRLAALAPDRTPGTPGAAAAAEAVRSDLREAAGVDVDVDRFTDERSGRALVNLLAVRRGASAEAIVVLAHRDTDGPGAGLVDNASGTGLLVELARGFAGTEPRTRTLVWASIDGAARGSAGAERLAGRLPRGLRPVAVLALDAVASADAGLPLRFDGGDRRTDPALVRSIEAALADAGPDAPRATTPRLLRQAVRLIAPVGAVGAQAPFVATGVPAVQLGGQEREDAGAPASRRRLEGVGLAVAGLLQSLDDDVPTAAAGSTYLYTRGRVVDGRALAVVVLALLVGPSLVAARLLARGRARRAAMLAALAAAVRLVLPLAGALAGARLAGAVGLGGDSAAIVARSGVGGVLLTLAGALLGVLAVPRVPRPRHAVRDDESAGAADWTVALALGCLGALLALVANPFSALLLVPALHAWILLPRLARAGATTRLATVWLPLVLPAAAVAVDLSLDPLELLAAVGSRVLPGATALGLAIAVAAAVLLTPAALGVATPGRATTTRKSTATV